MLLFTSKPLIFNVLLTLGIKENGESNCKNSELVYQVENAIPEGYTKSIFCAGNSVDVDATCRGDSGKYVFMLMSVGSWSF